MKSILLTLTILVNGILNAQYVEDNTVFPYHPQLEEGYYFFGGFEGYINNDKILDYIHFASKDEPQMEESSTFLMVVSLGGKKGTFTDLPYKYVPHFGKPLYSSVTATSPQVGTIVLSFNTDYYFEMDEPLINREITLKFDNVKNDFVILKDGGRNVILPGETLFVENEQIKESSWLKADLNTVKSYRSLFLKPQKVVTVSSLKEFLTAVDNNTIIELDMPVLDISYDKLKRFEFLIGNNPRLNEMDGELYITNCYNLTIRSKTKTEIKTTSETSVGIAVVLGSDITFENLIFNKQNESDNHTAMHLLLRDCYNVKIIKSTFKGPHVFVGLFGLRSNYILIENSIFQDIAECALRFQSVDFGTVANSTFAKNNLTDAVLNVYYSNVTFENNTFKDNSCDFQFISMYNSKVQFSSNKFINNQENETSDFYTEMLASPTLAFEYENNFFGFEYSEDDESYYEEATEVEYEDSDEIYYEDDETPPPPSDDEAMAAEIEPALDVIIEFITAENERNWTKIDQMLSKGISLYYDEKNPTRSFLQKTYENSWANSPESANEIVSVSKYDNAENTWFALVEFTFYDKKSKKNKTVESIIFFEFNDNLKIVKIYPQTYN
jgi:hypothetical protein